MYECKLEIVFVINLAQSFLSHIYVGTLEWLNKGKPELKRLTIFIYYALQTQTNDLLVELSDTNTNIQRQL